MGGKRQERGLAPRITPTTNPERSPTQSSFFTVSLGVGRAAQRRARSGCTEFQRWEAQCHHRRWHWYHLADLERTGRGEPDPRKGTGKSASAGVGPEGSRSRRRSNCRAIHLPRRSDASLASGGPRLSIYCACRSVRNRELVQCRLALRRSISRDPLCGGPRMRRRT